MDYKQFDKYKSVIYKDIEYRKYNGRRYYQPNGTYLAKGFKSLHQQIYIDHFGEIPDGFHVHHKDHGADNNDISNLELVEKGKHALLHYHERVKSGELPDKLKKWRSSKKGRETLRKNAYKMHKRTPVRKFSCVYCGSVVKTKHQTQKFCNKHKKYKGRKKVNCPICGKIFWKGRGKRATQTCGRICGAKLWKKNRLQTSS